MDSLPFDMTRRAILSPSEAQRADTYSRAVEILRRKGIDATRRFCGWVDDKGRVVYEQEREV
jgi:hypothetical protein